MRVSIIIPAYNAAAFIERAIDSAVAAGSQVPGGYEIIVVDNASTDATAQLIQASALSRPGTIIPTHTDVRGPSAARNHGVEASNGEWLQFLDADDTISIDKISHQLALAEGAEWIVGAYRHLYANGTTEDNLPHPDLWRGLFHDYRTGHTISNLLRREAFDRVGGWDERLAGNEDPDLHFRLLKAGVPFLVDKQINSYYHHHDGARITSGKMAERIVHRIQMLAAANAYLIQQRPEYWYENAPYFTGALLRSIRMLATYDLGEATEAYAAYFGQPNEWAIDRNYELVPRYTRLYPYLGFNKMERLRLGLTGILPQRLKNKLKS